MIDVLRAAEIALSFVITIVLLDGTVSYLRRYRVDPGSVVLEPREYVVMVACIIGLLFAASATVVSRLGNESPSVTLILSILVQPPLLWWAFRMQRRLLHPVRER